MAMRSVGLFRRCIAVAFGVGVFAAEVWGQEPRWAADVPAVERPGLYAIELSPELVGRSRPGLEDLRLIDSTGREVPYMLRVEPRIERTETFTPFTVLRNEVLDRRTVLEVELPPSAITSTLHLRVRNAEVDKSVRITGSDDQRNWYMVKDARMAVRGTRGDPPHPVLSIALPHVDRRYLRVELDDSLAAPVQVIDAGVYAGAERKGRMARDTAFRYHRHDSASHTAITVRSPWPIAIDRLVLTVDDTLPFRRDARLVTWAKRTTGRGRKRRTRLEEVTLARFTVSSAEGGIVELDGIRADTFAVRIANGDDRPLRLTDFQIQQLERNLWAHLAPGERYRLTTGDEKASLPRYDLTPFHTEGAAPIMAMAHGRLKERTGIVASPLFDPARAWIWVAVAGLVLAMGVTAFRLVRSDAKG